MMDAANDTPASLGAILRELSRETGLSMDNLSVLKADYDPYRLDTPAYYRNGQWFRRQMEACGLIRRDGGFARPIHNRGIHYAIFSKGATRPDSGRSYLNDADGWDFLERASKAARWLGNALATLQPDSQARSRPRPLTTNFTKTCPTSRLAALWLSGIRIGHTHYS